MNVQYSTYHFTGLNIVDNAFLSNTLAIRFLMKTKHIFENLHHCLTKQLSKLVSSLTLPKLACK